MEQKTKIRENDVELQIKEGKLYYYLLTEFFLPGKRKRSTGLPAWHGSLHTNYYLSKIRKSQVVPSSVILQVGGISYIVFLSYMCEK